MSNTLNKYKIILEEFSLSNDKTLTAYNKDLQEKLSLGQKQIDRLLEDLSNTYEDIILLKNTKRKTYKLIKPLDLFSEIFKHYDDIGWIFKMATDSMPGIFEELENYNNKNKNIYKFKNTPLEDISTIQSKATFKKLKTGVKNREYKKIKCFNEPYIDNLKCLQLIFMDNNWYIAVVDDDNLKFIRISFIESVEYASNIHLFQLSSVKEHIDFLNNKVQNSLTLFGVESQTATIKANPSIAKYFHEGMKIFLPSQKFIRKLDDGSVLFELEYTQDLEILTLIQKWLPDLVILKPKSLKEAYLKKLSSTIKMHKTIY